jgi:hypothetical protein
MKGDFLACPYKTRLADNLWRGNEPDNDDGFKQCTAINLSGRRDQIGFQTVPCLSSIVNPVCEVLCYLQFKY